LPCDKKENSIGELLPSNGSSSKINQFDNDIPTWENIPTTKERDERNEILAKLSREQKLKFQKRKRDPYDIEYDRGKQKKVKKKATPDFDGVNKFQALHSKRNEVSADPYQRRKLEDKHGKRAKRKMKVEKYERVSKKT